MNSNTTPAVRAPVGNASWSNLAALCSVDFISRSLLGSDSAAPTAKRILPGYKALDEYKDCVEYEMNCEAEVKIEPANSSEMDVDSKMEFSGMDVDIKMKFFESDVDIKMELDSDSGHMSELPEAESPKPATCAAVIDGFFQTTYPVKFMNSASMVKEDFIKPFNSSVVVYADKMDVEMMEGKVSKAHMDTDMIMTTDASDYGPDDEDRI